ncbi:DUF7344 domain-containing protein [Halomarina rubra]|uniref:DUF7344 domain-containing protein n=1 Tax=Halomarina rubra TaxID=2071873 RepID=A0ABD6AXL7_9EURY|nr:hypothetical protein [Halomarina rubra]
MGVDVPESWEPDDLSKDDALSLVSRAQRRNVLYALLETDDGALTRPQLVAILAAGRREKPPEDVDEEVRRTIAKSLDHTHLPKLADHDVVVYDREADHVELTATATDVLPLLQYVSDSE